MGRQRGRLGLLAALMVICGALALPATSLAAHESTCATAVASGDFNVISGAGTLFGTDGNDVIIGSAFDDTILGGGGDDVVCGRGGADRLEGENGLDRVLGDVCDGCEAFGENGTPGDDWVFGGNGMDTLWGDEGADDVFGGNGDDALIGGNPNGHTDETDTCDGGRGTDTATRCDAAPSVP